MTDKLDAAALGARVRARRRALGLSQRALARRAGVTDAFVSSIELGERMPSLDTLVRLCEPLRLSLDALALGSVGCDMSRCPLLGDLRALVERYEGDRPERA